MLVLPQEQVWEVLPLQVKTMETILPKAFKRTKKSLMIHMLQLLQVQAQGLLQTWDLMNLTKVIPQKTMALPLLSLVLLALHLLSVVSKTD